MKKIIILLVVLVIAAGVLAGVFANQKAGLQKTIDELTVKVASQATELEALKTETAAAAAKAAEEAAAKAAEADAAAKAAEEASVKAAAAAGRLAKILADGKLTVATSPDYAPYEFLDKDGNAVGADMSLAKFIAEKLGVELVIEKLDFDTVLAAISSGKVDIALAGMVPKEERKASMDFTDVYYNDGNQVILILKENAGTLKTLADFTGKIVAAQNGTLQQTLVTEQLPGATLEPIVKIPDAVMMLMTKKVDGLALASVVADQYIANYPDLVKCETAFEYTSLGVAAAVVKGETALLDAVNAIIKEAVDSNLYFTWMDEAIVLNNSLNK